MNYSIDKPISESEFKDYYYFRWKILRKPLGLDINSVKDNLEKKSFHLMITGQSKKIIAVGRMHLLENKNIAQIRYMAVDHEFQGEGLGLKILKTFEIMAKQKKVEKIILHARESAVGFYEKDGYKIKEKSHLLYKQVQHWLMYKNL